MTVFLVDKQPGFGATAPGVTILGKIEKMGYRGVETTEMVLDGARLGIDKILGGEEGRGQGFYQMMDGLEVGRVNVTARACGISIRAFELAVAYAQQRKTFGKQIAGRQAIAFKLAEMATKVEAAHLMMVNAARRAACRRGIFVRRRSSGGMALSQLGADVIRIDPLGGAADRHRWPQTRTGASLYWAGLNKGKRSLVVDMRSDAGRQTITDLVASWPRAPPSS